jgi:hypothetical protein
MKSLGVVHLEEEWVEEVVDLLKDELEIPNLDFEQKESLERIVMMSVAFYFMYAREAVERTTKLTQ